MDPFAGVARIKAGTRWGDVVEAVTRCGLAVVHGSSPVGRRDRLPARRGSFVLRAQAWARGQTTSAFDVVTRHGIARRVDAEQNSELFYGLRGRGGGYAVVTAVELDLLPYSEVTGGALFFGLHEAWRVLRAWRDWTSDAPDSITTTFRILCLPPLPDVPEPLRAVPTGCVNGVAPEPADAGATARRSRLSTGASAPSLGGTPRSPQIASTSSSRLAGRSRCRTR